MTKKLILVLILTTTFCQVWCDAKGNDGAIVPERAHQPEVPMRIRLAVGSKTLTATLADNQTARDFATLLPLTLTMKDLFRREKFAPLPRAISEDGKRQATHEVGDVIYWSPGPDVAVYYRDDGQRIPDPGIIVIGKIDAGIDALDVGGTVKVKIELVTDGKR